MNLVDDPHQITLVLEQSFDDRFTIIQIGNRHAIKPTFPPIMEDALNANVVVPIITLKLKHNPIQKRNDPYIRRRK